MKIIKKFLLIFLLIILIYALFPKEIGFTERMALPNGGEEILGEFYRCLGIKLSQETNNKTIFRCIGIPFSKTTI